MVESVKNHQQNKSKQHGTGKSRIFKPPSLNEVPAFSDENRVWSTSIGFCANFADASRSEIWRKNVKLLGLFLFLNGSGVTMTMI